MLDHYFIVIFFTHTFLSQVIKESGEIALSWVKTHAYDLFITNSRAHDPLRVPELIDIHLHLPAGAQKKDGPSAGIAMVRFLFPRDMQAAQILEFRCAHLCHS
jgi:ATP-dependent Lon protease